MKPYGIIYMLRNPINGKVYIGQTIRSLEQRLNGHRKNRKKPSKIGSAIKKHGMDFFEKYILDTAHNLDDLNQLEIFYIEKFCSVEFGYNLTYGGQLHKIYSEETRQKMRGRKQSEETLKKMSLSRVGRKLHPTTIAKLKIINNSENNATSQRVLCVNNGKVYFSQLQASRELNVYFYKALSPGDVFVTKDYIFCALDRDKKYSEKEIEDIVSRNRHRDTSKKYVTAAGIFCISNGKQYISHAEAARDLGIAVDSISYCVRNKTFKCKGFLFKEEIKICHSDRSLSIHCIDNNKTYHSYSSAARDLNISRGAICGCIKKGTFTTKGFTFRKLTSEETLALQNQTQQTSSVQTSQDLSQ